MKFTHLLCCWLLPVACLAQVDSALVARTTRMNQSGCQQLYGVASETTCAAATALAERDIQAHTPFLILASGEAPVRITTDDAFEQRFKVEYYEMGCISPGEACMRAYNERIFRYLQTTYGKAWRRPVRPDVVGLKHWKPAP